MAENDFPFGLYERLITERVKARLLRFDSATTRVVTEPVQAADIHATLGRHLQGVVTSALRGLPAEERTSRATDVTNALLRLLAQNADDPDQADEVVALPPTELREIRRVGDIASANRNVQRPRVPLSATDLMVNARREPALAATLAGEIPSADSIDLLCAFVRWHGLRLLDGPLRAYLETGRPLRVITTVYTGSTERRALDWLVQHGAQVKVSYDTQSTRLHAKAWLFRRSTGYSTAYIGSSNLSKSALIDGVEWNVRLSEVTSPDVLNKFDATFETYWASPEYERYEPSRDAERFDRAVAPGRAGDDSFDIAFLDVRPWPHQEEMLEKLAVERERHHRYRNLVVAATGTGKTIVAALDFKRLRTELKNPRLLFVAHRQEILKQSLVAFRQVLRDATFGELYVDGHRPDEWQHVFASIQSLSRSQLEAINPDAFDVVIIDEFHRAGAATYRSLLSKLSPKVLLGLTATPERTDGEDILGFFDNRIAVELRLWHAMERGLLCPFHYFGVHDNTDLSNVTWSRRGYDSGDLERIYTGNDARLKLVIDQLVQKHRDISTMRALGFCVSVEHAKFMARRFSEAGLPAEAVWAETESAARSAALKKLATGELRALFSVDVFNEGVDIPEVDTILMLRPTESALVFLQQLGRGLRRYDGKDCVTVLDFIGNAHRKFRFDLRYRAITGATRPEVEQQIEEGFPLLPAGCSMQLDRVATRIILDNLRTAIPSNRPARIRELRALWDSDACQRSRVPTLAEYLKASGLDLEDVFDGSSWWSSLKRAAGLPCAAVGPAEERLGKALSRMLHIDDPLRLAAYRRWVTGERLATDEPIVAGWVATVWQADGPASCEAAQSLLRQSPEVCLEWLEVMDLLEARAGHLTYELDDEMEWSHTVPLSVHARHSLVEILAAFGRITPGHFYQHREGPFRHPDTNSDLFFVTLEKNEKDYSPSTLYNDYAISADRFHWQSQSRLRQATETARRYIAHSARGGHVFLFVRERRKSDGRTTPYTFLGPADYVSHHGERPINFVWQLRRPMPADFYRTSKVAAG